MAPYASATPPGASVALHLAGYLGLAAALIVPLWWRDRPLTSFALVSLVSFGQWLAQVDLQPANIAVLVALWGWPTSARSGGRWPRA
ncbi:hypothetical protein ACFQ0B_74795 [Nonomuraea thailandensis]